MRSTLRTSALITVFGTSLVLAGCSSASEAETITVTGSATVEPITQLAATEHKASLDMTSDGTYDGFEEFCSGNSDINNASSAITQEFLDKCADNGVEFIELPIGLDALSLVTHNDNEGVTDLSLDELAEIWKADSQVETWSDVRTGLHNEKIGLYGRPEGSGTFSYFTARINGTPDHIREDYEKTDDIDELTGWIAEDSESLGFMGVGNYLAADEDERAAMKTVAVDGIDPTLENVQDGKYPLSRPLFVYVSVDALENKDGVEEFLTDYVDNAAGIVPRVYFYGLSEAAYDAVAQRLKDRETGSLMNGDPFQNIDINRDLKAH